MNRLMRMAYGHGGTKLGRILVATPQAEAADPRWLKFLFLAIWIVVPLMICRFSLPTHTQSTTVIDMSRLAVQPPPPLESIVTPVNPAEPLPKPAPSPDQPAQRPEQPVPEEANRPAISRPGAAKNAEAPEYQPRIARERLRVATETGPAAETRIRRETTATEPSAERTAILRTRRSGAADLPAARERVATSRRTPAVGTEGAEAPLRPFTRRERPADLSGTAEGGAQRVAAVRERRTATGAGAGEATTSVGLARGLSLASLEICSTPQAEEDAIKAVLGALGSRQSCRDETGEYRFTGTKRISSFNLIIRPAKGRRPTNRCEELENAYSCLKAH